MLKECRDHLHSVKESYFQHLCFATSFGARMIAGGAAAILHGLCPAIFKYTGSTTLFALNKEVMKRLQEKCPDRLKGHD